MIYDEPGRGRKACNFCEKYMGVREDMCQNCGHDVDHRPRPQTSTTVAVATRSVVAVEEPRPIVAPKRSGFSRIYAPAGECPVKLNGTDMDTVAEWAVKLQERFAERRSILSTAGLIYSARTFYDYHSSEFRAVKSVLLSLYPESTEDQGIVVN